MVQLVSNRIWDLKVDPLCRVVYLTRTPERCAVQGEALTSMDEVESALRQITPLHYGLLLDLRAAPVKNDPEFERMTQRYRRKIVSAFPRCAVLTATLLGKLQLERLSRDEGIEWEFLEDEELAKAYVSSFRTGDAPPSVRSHLPPR